MAHRFRVTVDQLPDPSVDPAPARSLSFEVSNHDDLLAIVDRVKNRDLLPQDEAAEFAIGLKLFTEVAMRHRQESLFAELWPHLGVFMKRLKQGS